MTRHLLRHITAAGALLIALGSTTGSAPPASASIYNNVSGSPGWVYDNPQQIAGRDRYIYDLNRTIMESPLYAGYQQDVCVTTTLWRVVYASGTGKPFWQAVDDRGRCYTIAAAANRAYDSGVLFGVSAGTFYRVTTYVTWRVGNTLVGTKNIEYYHVSDYVCIQGVYRCNIGFVFFGSQYAYINFQ
jgi:hypothetical protein